MSVLARFVLFVVCLSLVCTNPLVAQKKQADDSGGLGDIIRYTELDSKISMGLITEVSGEFFIIDRPNGKDLGSRSFHRPEGYEIVDKFLPPKKLTIRTWKTADSKFQVKARMVDFNSNRVTLEKEEGGNITVVAGKLSEKDQTYIGKYAKTLPGSAKATATTRDSPVLQRLKERRVELQQIAELHERLAKMNPEFVIGDIVRNHNASGRTHAIVSEVEPRIVFESVDENGVFKSTSVKPAWFLDREIVSKPLPQRSWGSATGKFKIEAQLVEIDSEDNLLLKKSSGDEITVPLAKVSKTDQEYVETVRAKLSGTPDSELVEERKNYDEELMKLLARRDVLLNRVSTDQATAKDASKVTTIALNTNPPELNSDQLKSRSLVNHLFEVKFDLENVSSSLKLDSIHYAEESGTLAFTKKAYKDKRRVLVVVPTKGDPVTAKAEIGDKSRLAAISPSGKTLLVHSPGDQRLELWSYQDGSLEFKSSVAVTSMGLLQTFLFSDESVAVLDRSGKLGFFDIQDRLVPTRVVSLSFEQTIGRLQVSQDRKSLFVLNAKSNSISVIDVASETCVGGFQFPAVAGKPLTSSLQVNPDGKTATRRDTPKRYAARSTIYDLATLQPVYEMDSRFDIIYLGEGISVFYDTVYDMKLKAKIGTLTGRVAYRTLKLDSNRQAVATHFTVGTHFRQIQVALERLPAKEIQAYAAELTPADVVKYGKGTTVAVKFDFPAGNSKLEAQLRSQLEEELTKGGITIADESDFVFTFSYKEPGSKTIPIVIRGRRTRDPDKPVGTIRLTEKRAVASLTYRGQWIWGYSYDNSIEYRANTISQKSADVFTEITKSLTPNRLLKNKLPYPVSIESVVPDKLKKFAWEK